MRQGASQVSQPQLPVYLCDLDGPSSIFEPDECSRRHPPPLSASGEVRGRVCPGACDTSASRSHLLRGGRRHSARVDVRVSSKLHPRQFCTDRASKTNNAANTASLHSYDIRRGFPTPCNQLTRVQLDSCATYSVAIGICGHAGVRELSPLPCMFSGSCRRSCVDISDISRLTLTASFFAPDFEGLSMLCVFLPFKRSTHRIPSTGPL